MFRNERIDQGPETVEVRFDLPDEQLLAVARIADAVKRERYMGQELDTDAVLALRELVALHDNALERAEDGVAGGTLVMTIARLGLALEAMREWMDSRRANGSTLPHEAADLAAAEALLPDLTDLHLRAMCVALGAEPPAYTLR